MAISDYTLSRLALAARARGLAAETEQAKAARDAQQQSANLAAVQQLLGAVPGVIGAVSDIGAAAGEAGIREATAGLTAGERAAEQLPSPIPQPAAAAPTAAPTAAAPDEMAAQMAGVPRVLRELGLAKPPADDEMAAQMAGVPDVLKRLGLDKQPVAEKPKPEEADITTEITAGQKISPDRQAARDAVQPFRDVMLTPEEKVAVAETQTRARLDDVIQKRLRMTPAQARAAEQEAMRAADEALAAETAPQTEKPVTEPEKPTAAAPAAEAPAAEGPVDPSVNEAKKAAAKLAPERDPSVVEQETLLKKIRSYQPPKYQESEEEAASRIVNDTWRTKQPNAILNILTFGQYNNKLEESRRLANKLVAGEIRKLRADEAVADRKQFESTAKLEAQQIALMQKSENDRRRAALQRDKNLNNPKMLEKLQTYNEVDAMIGEVEDSAKAVVEAGQQIPGGAEKMLEAARAMAIAATPAEARTAAAGLNASLVGLGANGAVSLGAKATDEDGLQAAIDAIDSAQMSDLQKTFVKKQLIMIQAVGKAKEGGRMTDKDLQFYLRSLIVKDAKNPSTLLRSINDLRQNNARSQRDWMKIYTSLYPDAPPIFDALNPAWDADLAARADELGWAPITEEYSEALGRTRGSSLADVAQQGGKAAVDLAQRTKANLGDSDTAMDSLLNRKGL
jgi:hypothetical protein